MSVGWTVFGQIQETVAMMKSFAVWTMAEKTKKQWAEPRMSAIYDRQTQTAERKDERGP